MSKLSKDKQQKLTVVVVATLGLVAVLWFLMISPLMAKLERLQKQATEAQAMVEKGRKSIDATLQVSNELAGATGKLKTAEALMASGDLYEWMIQTMNRFKTSHRGLEVPQISRETPCEVGMFPGFPYKGATFSLRGTAFYHDLGDFLADLENTFPYAQVQNLLLTAGTTPGTPETERLQFSLDVMTLVKPVTP